MRNVTPLRRTVRRFTKRRDTIITVVLPAILGLVLKFVVNNVIILKIGTMTGVHNRTRWCSRELLYGVHRLRLE